MVRSRIKLWWNLSSQFWEHLESGQCGNFENSWTSRTRCDVQTSQGWSQPNSKLFRRSWGVMAFLTFWHCPAKVAFDGISHHILRVASKIMVLLPGGNYPFNAVRCTGAPATLTYLGGFIFEKGWGRRSKNVFEISWGLPQNNIGYSWEIHWTHHDQHFLFRV